MGLVSLPIVIVAVGFGCQLLRWAGAETKAVAERWSLGAAIGLGVYAYAIQALGLAGGLAPAAIVGLTAAMAIAGAPATASLLRDSVVAIRKGILAPWTPDRLLAIGFAGMAVAIAGMTLGGALGPFTELDYDSLAYHLAVPRLYLLHQRIFYVDHLWHANIPFTCQMWYVAGLALDGPGAAKLFHWSAGWLTAVGAAAWVARGKGMPCWAPAMAALVFLAIPLGAWEATTAYIDLGTALYLTAALVAFDRAREQGFSPRWLAVTGALAGWAAGTKYPALVQLALLGAGVGIAALVRRERAAVRGVVAFALAASVIAAPWFVRNFLWTGNPVYPFYARLFPRTRNWNEAATVAIERDQRGFGRGTDAVAAARLLWDTAFHGREYFLAHRPLRALPHDILMGMGVVFVGLLPLLALVRGWEARALGLLAFLVASTAAWFLTSQQSRYLLPVMGAAAALVGWLVPRLPWRPLRVAALALVAIQGVGTLWGSVILTEMAWPVVLGRQSEEEALSQGLRDLYDAGRYTGLLPPGSRIALYQEARGYYLERDYLRANPLHHDLIPYDRLTNGAELADFLRDRLRITHVLLNQGGVSADVLTQEWFRLLTDAYARGRLRPLWYSARARPEEDLLRLTAVFGPERLGALLREKERQTGSSTGRGIVIYTLQ